MSLCLIHLVMTGGSFHFFPLCGFFIRSAWISPVDRSWLRESSVSREETFKMSLSLSRSLGSTASRDGCLTWLNWNRRAKNASLSLFYLLSLLLLLDARLYKYLVSVNVCLALMCVLLLSISAVYSYFLSFKTAGAWQTRFFPPSFSIQFLFFFLTFKTTSDLT